MADLVKSILRVQSAF